MISMLTRALCAHRRRSSRIFIAWSHESKAAADGLRAFLHDEGFATWLSGDIKGGRRFREEIGNRIRDADLVIAVFPVNPSHWIVAEAGLAYFEQKLIPIVVGADFTSDPFEDLQILKFRQTDIDTRSPSELASLVHAIEDRLGCDSRSLLPYVFRLFNFLFFLGVPILGITLVGSFLWRSLHEFGDPNNYDSFQLWKAGHIVLGAIVYGGSAFITLLFSRAGISNSFIERQFCITTAQRLFIIWFGATLLQMFGGFYLLRLSQVYDFTQKWVVLSLICYFIALISFLFGFICYRWSSEADAEGREKKVLEGRVFIANLCFGMGLVTLTAVIVLMSLKDEATYLLML